MLRDVTTLEGGSVRPILLAALAVSVVATVPFFAASGCAAGGETNPGTSTTTSETGGGNTTSTTSSKTGGAGGATNTGGTASTGGNGGNGAVGGSTGGAGGGTACVPEAEVCDGKDNDCNGIIDDTDGGCLCKEGDKQPCFTGDPTTLGIGECVGGTSTCDLAGAWGPCVGEVVASPEVCDGKDNDCDGTKDNGLGTTTCGLGICQVIVDNCVGGVVQTCTPGVPSPEKCNTVDDNCDGNVDEGCKCVDGTAQPCYTGPPSTMNVGECKPGTQLCQGGDWGPCQNQIVPTTETCNAKDDDCDGNLDDGLGTTVCGVGTCQVVVDNCVGGVVQTCTPGQPGIEICDGKDNDCNGTIDDAGTITCGLGACFNTVPACANGLPNVCNALQPQVEVCDGIDNNCNGVVDDGNPGGGGACTTGLAGICTAGTLNCIGGTLQCVQNAQPSAELCDGQDNNCDSNVDEGNPGGGLSCNTGKFGVCATGTTACANGAIACNQNVQPTAEICDGFDNNCNGASDEGNPGGGVACNTGKSGACAAGTTACSSGAIVCNQDQPPSAESCDGIDNNCNGTVDEGNPGGGLNCNTGLQGLCAQGTTACANGAIACNQNVQPAVETCDGLDNNCNGQVDDGNPGGGVACNTGKPGACAPGTTACTNGAIACNQNAQPVAETCDGIDNNCNGQVDDGNPGGGVACNTGKLGVCAVGTTACTNGVIVCNQNVQPGAETCDGLDNNCDGQVDEGNPGSGVACNTGKPGLCAAGTTACQNGTIVCNQTLTPSPEACDGFDNNCNGATDEGNPGGGLACSTGKLGACAVGTTACTSGAIACNQNTQPSAEACDGVDNNCNGQVDEGNPGGGLSCNTGLQGVCGPGTTACSNGAIACNQNVQPAGETCDGLDNNCNGQVDEGNPGGGVPCNTGLQGVCAAGTTACQGGVIVCVQNVQPSAETCDGLDNNCNGQIDDGNPGGGAACNTGLQGVCAAGATACQGGTIVCNQNVQPSAETCDGLDNDCNGVVDNGNPGGGAACNTGKQGVCAAGTSACTAGAVVCNQNVQPSAETCDGLDNDCNGVVDNGNPGGGLSCNTGLSGICSAGTTACTSGTIHCNQNNQPTAEICNGLDDDCNGTVDNGNPGGGFSCNTGKSGICSAGTTACSSGSVVCTQNQQPQAESCNGVDDDCNGAVDNGNPGGGAPCNTGKQGACAAGTTACSGGGIACNQNALPSTETCDGIDNNCDGAIDNALVADNMPTSCATATNKTLNLTLGTSANVSGYIDMNGDDWFIVNFTGNTNTAYHPRVRFITNPGTQFTFDVLSNCTGSALSCGAEGGVSTGLTDWEVQYTAGDPNDPGTFQPIPAVGASGKIFVHVTRKLGTGATTNTCGQYTITVSN